MKVFFALLLAATVLLYGIAKMTLETPPRGVVVLRWATDPNPARFEQCRIFSEQHPRIRVVPEAASDDKLLVQCAVGVGPDIMDMSEALMQQMVEADVLTDFTVPAERGGFSVKDTYPQIRSVLEVNGRQYRYPCNVSADVIIYNKKVFDDHGVPYPKPGWTYDDFISTAQKIRDNPSKSGLKHTPVTHWGADIFVRDLMVAHDVRMFDDSGKVALMANHGMIDALTLYHDMIYRYGVLPRPEESAAASSQGGWGFGGINIFSSGQAAMICIGRWYTVQVGNYPALIGNLGVVEMPGAKGREPASEVSSRAAGVNKLSLHPAESLEFIKFLASNDYNRLIVEDGDSMPPNPAFARSGKDLVNPQLSDAAAQQVFLDAIGHGKSLGRSPFIDAVVVNRWLKEKISALENNTVTPEEAAVSLNSEIERAMQQDSNYPGDPANARVPLPKK